MTLLQKLHRGPMTPGRTEADLQPLPFPSTSYRAHSKVLSLQKLESVVREKEMRPCVGCRRHVVRSKAAAITAI